MKIVGYYRDIIFRVEYSVFNYIMTFNGLNRSMGANWATHPSIGGLERIEKTGDKLQDLSFSMLLRSDAGVSVRETIDRLQGYVEDGKSGLFVLGGYPIAQLEWIIMDIGAKYNTVLSGGRLLSATVDVKMKQYH